MIYIGQYNTLRVARIVDFGLYLVDPDNVKDDVLLPARYIEEVPAAGDIMTVFVYKDSENRIIATTERPYATVGQVVFLQVKDVTAVGAFMEWGLSKDLLVPFAEQKVRMQRGGIYPVYIYLDNASGRIVGSARLERHVGNKFPDMLPGTKVMALPVGHTPIGYRCVVDNTYFGMIYNDEVTSPVEIGVPIDAWVKNVRDDGKIDLATSPRGEERIDALATLIIDRLHADGGSLPLSDNSSPELIRELLGCSKKDFKKAVGHLYKSQRIIINERFIALNS